MPVEDFNAGQGKCFDCNNKRRAYARYVKAQPPKDREKLEKLEVAMIRSRWVGTYFSIGWHGNALLNFRSWDSCEL